jgi:hypothetical protein
VGSTAGTRIASDAPPPITQVINPPLPREGQWRATGPLAGGVAPVLVTTFRPDPNYPQMIAGVAWIDASRTQAALYPGRYEPPNDGTQAGEVPPQLRASLLATFNSGFKLEDGGGGFVASGHVYAPLTDGQATLVGYRDGTVDVRTWTGAPDPGPEISLARTCHRSSSMDSSTPSSATTPYGAPRSATPCGSGAQGSASMPTET